MGAQRAEVLGVDGVRPRALGARSGEQHERVAHVAGLGSVHLQLGRERVRERDRVRVQAQARAQVDHVVELEPVEEDVHVVLGVLAAAVGSSRARSRARTAPGPAS